MNIEEIIKSGQGTIVDVRTTAEFAGGHVAGPSIFRYKKSLQEWMKLKH